MTTPASATDRAWLTVIAWPEQYAARSQLLDTLAEMLHSDTPTMRHHADRSPPTVLGWFSRPTSEAAVKPIVDSGGDAIVMSLDDVQSLGPTMKIKDIRIEPAGLTFDCWRADSVTIDPGDIDVIVRATMQEQHGTPESTTTLTGEIVDGRQSVIGGTLEAWAIGRRAASQFADWSTMDRRVDTSHKLDVHVRNQNGQASVYQIDADKFAFRILGDLRGHSDNTNIDRMCEFIQHLNSDVIVDAYFPLWKPPPGAQRLRLPMMQYNKEDPSFAFYSRWATIIYRTLRARPFE